MQGISHWIKIRIGWWVLFIFLVGACESGQDLTVDGGEEVYNQDISGEDLPPGIPPDVTDFKAFINKGEVKLSWKNPTSAYFTGVRIVRKNGEVSTGPEDGDLAYQGSDESLVEEPLPQGTYYYTAFTYNAYLTYSSGQGVTVIVDLTPPADVTDFTATPGDEKVSLSWQNPVDADFKAVLIRRSIESYPETPEEGEEACDGPEEVCEDEDLVNGTRYYYTAFAYDTTGNYSEGVIEQATPADTEAPANVLNFAAAINGDNIILTWQKPAGGDYKGVVIRRAGVDYPTLTSGVLVYNGSAATCTDIGLNGGTYYYSAFSYDEVPNYSTGAFAETTMFTKEYVVEGKVFSNFYPRSIAVMNASQWDNTSAWVNASHWFDTSQWYNASKWCIAYGQKHLYVACNASVFETVDPAYGVGEYASIVADRESETYHISYYDRANQQLKYVSGKPGNWGAPQVVDPNPNSGQYCSIALDLQKNVHIGYIRDYMESPSGEDEYEILEHFYEVWHATNKTGQWDPTFVGNGTRHVSIGVDGSGGVHLSFQQYTYEAPLKYATDTTGSWEVTSLENIDVWDYMNTDLVVDSNGWPHISYVTWTGVSTNNYDLKYIRYNSSGWLNPSKIRHTTTNSQYLISLALDEREHPHFVNILGFGSESRYGDLYHKYHNGTDWYESIIAGYSWYPSIGLSPQENSAAYISYYNDSSRQLSIAFSTPIFGNGSLSWDSKALDTLKVVGQYPAIAVDTHQNVHVAYCDNFDSLLYYSKYNHSRWVQEKTIPVSRNCAHPRYKPSIAVDDQDSPNVHIAYTNGSNIQFVVGNGQTWTSSTLNYTPNMVAAVVVAADKENNIHLSYTGYDSFSRLNYWKRSSSGSWISIPTQIFTGTSGTEVGEYKAVAIGPDNKIHIVYTQSTYAHPSPDPYTLRYAWYPNESSSWSDGEISSLRADFNGTISIGVDSSGYVHIIYVNDCLPHLPDCGDMFYVTNKSGGWTTTNFHDVCPSESSELISWASLAIDPEDPTHSLHIAFYDYSSGALKYVDTHSGAWVRHLIDTKGDVGNYPAIVQDRLDPHKVHIGYYDQTNGSLKYATNSR